MGIEPNTVSDTEKTMNQNSESETKEAPKLLQGHDEPKLTHHEEAKKDHVKHEHVVEQKTTQAAEKVLEVSKVLPVTKPEVDHFAKAKGEIRPENKKQDIIVRPKLNGFLVSYIIFSIPGFLAGLVWTIVSVVLLFSIIGGIAYANQASTGQDPASLNLKVIQDNKEEKGILIYDLSGPISTGGKDLPISTQNAGIYTGKVASDFKKIKENKNIKNVVFRINTPGGEVYGAEILGDLIADLMSSLNQKQAVYYFDQIVASGGLFASYKNPNYVIASPYGETGSIGVLITLPNYKGIADKIGYSETVIKSADKKDIGNPFRDPTNSEIKYFQDSVDRTFKEFKNIIVTGRKIDPKVVDSIANGLVYENSAAKEYGLVDELGSVDRAVEKAAVNAGFGTNYKVWETTPQKSVLDSFLASSYLDRILKVGESTTSVVDKASYFKTGRAYMIDEVRI
ncbi:MAG: S49 family peptidase [bacterium]